MAYWLIGSPDAGDGSRNTAFWLPYLAAEGVTDVTVRGLDDVEQWSGQVTEQDCLLAAGGDGTVNAVAALCLKTGSTLAVLPSGTANDFARNLGLPADPSEIARLVAEGLTQQLDVAASGDRIFLNVAHIGLGSLPARQASTPAKRYLGKFSYAVTLARKVGSRQGFHARIRTDNTLLQGRWLSIAIATGAYFGGGQEVPEASANDGLLDIIAVRPGSLVQLLLTFLTVRFRGSTPPTNSTVVQVKGSWCRVDTHRPRTVTLDGDVAGKTPFEVTCRPGVLRVIGRQVISTGKN